MYKNISKDVTKYIGRLVDSEKSKFLDAIIEHYIKGTTPCPDDKGIHKLIDVHKKFQRYNGTKCCRSHESYDPSDWGTEICEKCFTTVSLNGTCSCY